MGYRSDVVLAVSKKAMPYFMATVTTVPDGMALCFEENTTIEQDYCDEQGSILFHWDSIKWYDSYAGIHAIEKFMDEMDSISFSDKESGLDMEYRFVRVGEDYDDVQVRGYGFDHINFSREIYF